MDGEMALWYVRARYSTSDFDRLRRAQEVIQGIFVKMLTLDGITRAPELYDLFKTSVETDMTLADILTLLPMATKLTDTNQVKRFAVSQDYVTPWMTEGGASVQIPDQEKIWNEIITDAVYGQ
jgi:anionic cell wall polymer biosynthesis LytR-Cps2A-Psr (LCP) family protein